MAKRPTKVSFEPDGEDLDPGLREAPQMQIYKESPLLSAFDPETEAGERAFPSYKDGLPIPGTPSRNREPAFADLDVVAYHPVDELKKLREEFDALREELAQHEADRRTELAVELDKHITIWARGRITQEHVRRTL